MAKTAGEKVFELYAGENRIGRQRHPKLDHPERPDYLVQTPAGEVVCEVEDFGSGDLDKAAAAQMAVKRVRLPDGRDVGGVAVVVGRDPALRIKRRIAAAARQLAPYASQYPTLAVLFNPGAIVDSHERVTAWAINDLIHDVGRAPISAVAVLEGVRPAAGLERKAMRQHHRRDKYRGLTREESLPRLFEFLQELKKRYPLGFFDDEHPRLRIFHLPSPPQPLAPTAFVGPFDEQVRLVPGRRAGLKIVRMKKRWARAIRGRL